MGSIDARRGRAIAGSDDPVNGRKADVCGIHIAFRAGLRPDRADIRKFVDDCETVSIAFDPAEKPRLRIVDDEDPNSGAASPVSGPHWIELVTRGVSFDLCGIAPSEPILPPKTNYAFDVDRTLSESSLETLELFPGAHLSGGEKTIPILKAMFGLCRDIVHHFPAAEAVVWSPAQSIIGRRFFESTITAWVDGGAFPALGLTAFRETMDGGLQSVGLNYLIGQELRIEPALAADRVAATRLGIRLINQLVMVGRVSEREWVIAPDGRRLCVEPSENGKYVRVQGE